MTLTENKNIARNLGATAFAMDKKIDILGDKTFAAMREGKVWKTRAELMKAWYQGYFNAHSAAQCNGQCVTCQTV